MWRELLALWLLIGTISASVWAALPPGQTHGQAQSCASAVSDPSVLIGRWRVVHGWGDRVELERDPQGAVHLHEHFTGRFPMPAWATSDWLQKNRKMLRTAVAIDFETTGLDIYRSKAWEIGLQEFTYHLETGEIVALGESYAGIEDPEEPLPEVIKKLSRVDDAQLKGRRFHQKRILDILGRANVLIAFNAPFDRPFAERYFPITKSIPWACAYWQVDWKAHGNTSLNQGALSLNNGFEADEHRALIDSQSLVYLLSKRRPDGTATYLHELLGNARTPWVKFATRLPYASRDALRTRGYFWDGGTRTNFRYLPSSLVDAEYGAVGKVLAKDRPAVEDVTTVVQYGDNAAFGLEPWVRIGVGSNYRAKEALEQLGYAWEKSVERQVKWVPPNAVPRELERLRTRIFLGNDGLFNRWVVTDEITPVRY